MARYSVSFSYVHAFTEIRTSGLLLAVLSFALYPLPNASATIAGLLLFDPTAES